MGNENERADQKVKSKSVPPPVQNRHYDKLLQATMKESRRQSQMAHCEAANAWGEHVTPLSPKDGFYDQRYVCATRPLAELCDLDDFKQLFLGDYEEGEPPPEKITLAMKGLTHTHIEWLSYCLNESNHDEDEYVPGHGVQMLWLNDNDIGEYGAQLIGNALKNNTSLKELYMQYTNIRDGGLHALMDALKTNKTLQRLELGCCNIGEEGVQKLKDRLRKKEFQSSALRHLGLFGNADSALPNLHAYFTLETEILPREEELREREARAAEQERGGKERRGVWGRERESESERKAASE
eukprot:1098595-Pleurochrysis_carterae.AAC.6